MRCILPDLYISHTQRDDGAILRQKVTAYYFNIITFYDVTCPLGDRSSRQTDLAYCRPTIRQPGWLDLSSTARRTIREIDCAGWISEAFLDLGHKHFEKDTVYSSG